MNKFTVISILIITLSSCSTPNDVDVDVDVNALFSKNQLEEDFSILESSLKNNHPNLDTYTPMEEIDSLLAIIKTTFRDSINAIEFYRTLTPILPYLGNNHTNIIPPENFIQFLNTEAKRFPFRMHHYKDTLYVSGDYSDEYIIKEGKALISINGLKVSDIFNEFIANTSTDGFNRTQPAIRASHGFSRYLAYHYDLWESFEIGYLTSAQEYKIANIKALTTSEIIKNQKERNKQKPESKEDYSFRISKDIGILTIKTFTPNSTGSYKSFLKKSFQEVTDKDLHNLIIDLRNNLGGFPEASDELLSYLINDALQPIRSEYAITNEVYNKSHFEHDGFFKHFNNKEFIKRGEKYHVKGSENTVLEPKKESYSGDLFVLINGNSSSTTGQLLGLIKSYTNALFMGEESGGNPVGIVADDILTLILPNSKIQVKIPMIYSEMNTNFKNQGRGIIPDILISEKVEEWISSEDIVLERALNWINQKEL